MDNTTRSALGLTPGGLALALLAGAALGFGYTLSPLTVWFALGFPLLCGLAVRDLEPGEARVILAILIVAVVLRLLVVAGLFFWTDHGALPFGSLFGDEEYFKRRSLWLRSIALQVDISEADRIYAFDEYSNVGYLYFLALLQVLVGSAPYGVHLLGIFLYLAGAIGLYRFARRTFGPAPAVVTLVLVLFFPSLFLWSVSALRESSHFVLTVGVLAGAIEAFRSGPWRRRLGWGAAAIVSGVLLRDLRAGSLEIASVAAVGGLIGGMVARRPRLLTATVLVVITAGTIALSRPAVRDRLLDTIREAAQNHQGHVYTPGQHYKLLEPAFYFALTRDNIKNDLHWPDALRFTIRALVAFVTVPLPWHAQTTFTRAYLPEQMAWWAIAALFPFGIWIAWRHAPSVSVAFTLYVVLMSTAIAIRSGNVGTLVRHRGLVLPFMMCLSAVALCHLVARAAHSPRDERSVLGESVERTL